MHQPRCGIYLQRRPHNQHDIGLGGNPGSGLELGHRLSEPYDVGAQLHSALVAIAQVDGLVAHVDSVLVLVGILRTDLGRLTVEVDHLGAAALLVEVVDILCHDRDIVILLEFRNQFVGLVGLLGSQFAAALVVELQHQGTVAPPPFYGGHIGHIVVFPEAVAVAEGTYAALGAHSRAGQYYKLFHIIARNSVF